MTYPIIPTWIKPHVKDKFTYPLRSKEDIRFDQEVCPPNFPITLVHKQYRDPVNHQELKKIDQRNEEVRMIIDIDSMCLSPQQKERIIFLLGNRYKGSPKVKINCRQYDNFEDNYYKTLDIIKQLYWEAKRAPGFDPKYLRPRRRYRVLKKLLGKTLQERNKKLEEMSKVYEEFSSNYIKVKAEGDTKEKYEKRVLERYRVLLKDEVDRIKEKHPEFVEEEGNVEERHNEFLKKERAKRAALSKKLILTQDKFEKEVRNSGLSDKAHKFFNENIEDTKEENKNN
jgi:hypothetical protein